MNRIVSRARTAAIAVSVLCVGAIWAVEGCSRSQQPRPLSAQSFYPGSTYGGARSGTGEQRIQEHPRSEIDQTQKTSGVTFPKPRKPDPLPPPNVSLATQPTTASATTHPTSGGGQ